MKTKLGPLQLLILVLLTVQSTSAQTVAVIEHSLGRHKPSDGTVILDAKEKLRLRVNYVATGNDVEMWMVVREVRVTSFYKDKLPHSTIHTYSPARGALADVKELPLEFSALIDPTWDVESRSVDEVFMRMQVEYYDQATLLADPARAGYSALVPVGVQVQEFNVQPRHYGFYALLDFAPFLSKTPFQWYDAIGGVLAAAEYMSLDYAATNDFKGSGWTAKTSLVSTPVLSYQMRGPIHFELSYVLSKEINSGGTTKQGWALGLIKTFKSPQSLLKIGYIEGESKEKVNYFISVSLPEFARLLSDL